jgi:hypothetical protein
MRGLQQQNTSLGHDHQARLCPKGGHEVAQILMFMFQTHCKNMAPIDSKMQDLNKASHEERAKKKRVRFATRTCVEEIEPVPDDNWYSRQDFVSFQTSAATACLYHHRDSVSISLKRMNLNDLLSDENDQTIRGLEGIAMPDLGLKRKRQRRRVINSVLIAQATARDHQEQHEGLDAEKFIAYFAAKESKRAKELAAKLGKEDEMAITRAEGQPFGSVNERRVLHIPTR